MAYFPLIRCKQMAKSYYPDHSGGEGYKNVLNFNHLHPLSQCPVMIRLEITCSYRCQIEWNLNFKLQVSSNRILSEWG